MRAAESGSAEVADAGRGIAAGVVLFELIEVCGWGGVAEEPAHGDDLAFVMEGMGKDVIIFLTIQ